MTREMIPRANRRLEYAESVINHDRYLLNTGNISITEYVIALKDYITVKRNLNQYRIKALQITTEINYWNQ